jgi:hypothetical protein
VGQGSPPGSTPAPSPFSMIKHQLTQLQDSMKGAGNGGQEPHRSPTENDRPKAVLPKTHAVRSSPYKRETGAFFEDKPNGRIWPQGDRVGHLYFEANYLGRYHRG